MNGWICYTRICIVLLMGISIASGARAEDREGTGFGSQWQMNLGPSVVFNTGPTTIGAGMALLTPFKPNSSWAAGVDTGMYVRTNPIGAVVPFLPFVMYRDRGGTAVPYIGVGLGPTFFLTNPVSMEGSLVIKPGLEFRMQGGIDLYLEPRFGLFGSVFVFYPQFGVILTDI